MENTNAEFSTQIIVERNFLLITASGKYSLSNAKDLFKFAVDNSLLHNKNKALIDITGVNGIIPVIERFQYSEFLSTYIRTNALGKVGRIAVVGNEPIVDKGRFGETVAINRGVNVRVFTDMNEASNWINQ